MKFKKLVVLDKVDFFGDQEARLKSLADETVVYSDTPDEEEAIKRIGDAEGIITSWTTITKKIIDSCPDLKYIGIYATGYSWIDVDHATERGITVTSVPGYATESVAEMVFGQLICLLRNSGKADRVCRQGKFERDGLEGEELKGKTLGIIGLGRIGTRVAEIGKAFGMNILYYSKERKIDVENSLGIMYGELDDLIKNSDVITIHSSSNDEFLGEKELEKVKDSSIIINFGVAGAVNEDALIKELKSGRLKAIIDHFMDHKIKEGLIEAEDNSVLTPEIGYYTRQALYNLAQICIDNSRSYLEGRVQNKVNK